MFCYIEMKPSLLIHSENDINPMLEALKEIIIDKRRDTSGPPRVIVFCMTREQARAICGWMSRDPELGPLNPDFIVGLSRSADTGTGG